MPIPESAYFVVERENKGQFKYGLPPRYQTTLGIAARDLDVETAKIVVNDVKQISRRGRSDTFKVTVFSAPGKVVYTEVVGPVSANEDEPETVSVE